tara:strand:- start:510 stop:638 length:129 start_codon:yes stop_codon:yes gene_type:complete
MYKRLKENSTYTVYQSASGIEVEDVAPVIFLMKFVMVSGQVM